MTKISSLKEKIGSGNIPLFIELYGANTEVLKQQADRYASLMDDFKSTYGADDVALFSAPGRTEIGGNHTDHQYGRVLAGAVNLDNIAVAAKNNTHIIRVKSVGYPEFQVDLNDLTIDESRFYTSDSIVRGINARMKELAAVLGILQLEPNAFLQAGADKRVDASQVATILHGQVDTPWLIQNAKWLAILAIAVVILVILVIAWVFIRALRHRGVRHA